MCIYISICVVVVVLYLVWKALLCVCVLNESIDRCCIYSIYSHDFALAVVELLLLLTADVLLFELALSNPVINVSMINLIVIL